MVRRALDREDVGEASAASPSVPSAPLTDRQRQLLAEVYVRIAQALPTEGRDYVVRIGFPPSGSGVNVRVSGLTEVGRAFAKHVAEFLNKENINGRKG